MAVRHGWPREGSSQHSERDPRLRRDRGTFSEDEVTALSKLLRTGALPASLNEIETRTVGASLGADSIREGVRAAIVGVLVVMAFMLFYYRGSGINADLALFLNLVILLGFHGLLNATLTCPASPESF